MSDEDTTKTTRYVKALEAVAEAADMEAKAQSAYDEAWGVTGKRQGELQRARRALRGAVNDFRALTGRAPIPESEEEKRDREQDEAFRKLKGELNSGGGTL